MSIIKRILFWLLLSPTDEFFTETKSPKIDKKAALMTPERPAWFLFEILHIGRLQVYCFFVDDKPNIVDYSKFYWRDVESPAGYGPFPNLNDAMRHYSETIQLKKNPLPPDTSLIMVDFKNKRRIAPIKS